MQESEGDQTYVGNSNGIPRLNTSNLRSAKAWNHCSRSQKLFMRAKVCGIDMSPDTSNAIARYKSDLCCECKVQRHRKLQYDCLPSHRPNQISLVNVRCNASVSYNACHRMLQVWSAPVNVRSNARCKIQCQSEWMRHSPCNFPRQRRWQRWTMAKASVLTPDRPRGMSLPMPMNETNSLWRTTPSHVSDMNIIMLKTQAY